MIPGTRSIDGASFAAVRRFALAATVSVLAGCVNGPPERRAGAVDFSGIWDSPGPQVVKLPEQNSPAFTPQAARNMAHYQQYYVGENDDPAYVCLLKGMPWSVLQRPRDYPVEIYQTPERIVMHFELYDNFRTIRLDEKTFPEDVPPSGNGYSIGHWEGDTLVVETRNMTAINAITPYPRSAEARVIERWQRRQDPQYGDSLHVDITVIDPLVYAQPGRGEGLLKRAPAGVHVGGYNCSEQLWDNYVAHREKELAQAGAAGRTTGQ